MANPILSSQIERLVSILAGSRFQDSYPGSQIRSRIAPETLQTNFEQLRRGEFAFLRNAWSGLTTLQRQSFTTAAATLPAGLGLFLQANINLTLIEEPIISTYLAFTSPSAMPLAITALTPATFLVQASTPLAIVPADTKLLLYATTDKPTAKIFTDPAEYTPVKNFDEGFDLSGPADIILSWVSSYGQMRVGRRICIKSVLIDKRNGTRGPSYTVCAVTTPPIVGNFIIDDAGNFLIDSTSDFITYP